MWKTIESCPHDVSVLLYGELIGEIYGPFEKPAIVVGKGYNANSFHVDSTDAYSVQVIATHWDYLPPPPEDCGHE